MAAESLGHIEPYINSYIITEIIRACCQIANIGEIKNNMLWIYAKFAKDLQRLQGNLDANVFDKKMYKKYVSLFVDRNKRKLDAMPELQKYLFYSQTVPNAVTIHYLEKLFIQLLGHSDLEIRDHAIVLLNTLYDGVDWQHSEAFVPVIKISGTNFSIEERIFSRKPLSEVIIMLNAPSYFKDCPLTVMTWHVAEVKSGSNKDEYMLDAKFSKFWRCGFYDWRVVSMNEEGKIEMLKTYNQNSEKVFAQGRFIVQPKDISEQQIHEIMVDYKDNDSDPDKNFFTLAKELNQYATQGITSLYLFGVLERDNGVVYDEALEEIKEIQRPKASPLAITDRSFPSRILGGHSGFNTLMAEAKRAKIKILVDCLSRVSSSRIHRKYKSSLLHILDGDGRLTLCYGTDGRAIKYEDTALLNYRKLKSWNLLIEDVTEFARKYNIDGLHLDNGQAWPQIMELDEYEMYRHEADGRPAYTEKEILNGEVVIKNENHGYWNSTKVDTYANPIFIKLCRKLWAEFPEFHFVGECWGGSSFENRQGILARSGIIPRLFKLPIAIASLFGKQLQKDGAVKPCHPQNVKALRTWYEQNRRFLPKGAHLIQSSSSHSWPYPAHLYERAIWCAVDMLFFMPDIPMTFMDEIKGSVFRRSTTNVYQARPMPRQKLQRAKSQLQIAMEEADPDEVPDSHVDESKKIVRVKSSSSISVMGSSQEVKSKEAEVVKKIGPEYGFDLKKIHLHYEHRRKLRREKLVLRHGELVPLDAKHSEGWHSHVFAFARFSYSETAIIAINFSNYQVSFFIDFTNLLPYFKKYYHSKTVVIFFDWNDENMKDYYFLVELMSEKMEFTLPPFGSTCKAIIICKDDPMVSAMSLDKSFTRLCQQIAVGKDCSFTQPCQELLTAVNDNKSINEFAMIIGNLYKNYLHPQGISMHVLLHRLDSIKENTLLGAKLSAYCKKLVSYKAKGQGKHPAVMAAEEMIMTNQLGPIVFFTPELGRWSTVGGLGVMVDELTQGLALLKEDVYVITPYYNVNRKGEAGYLAKDPASFSHVKDIHIRVAGEGHTIGVHRGVINNVNLVFLHNFTLFPAVYAEGNAGYILKQIAAFAKAGLEYLCSEKLIPSVIVTNDWYTGLVAAYKRVGAFGSIFNGTTFIHIFHNLQELYEGRLYPSPNEKTLDHIHELPADFLVDFTWRNIVINPSRCATICSDQWATVSKSYRNDLLNSSPLAPILRNHPRPFAFPNGIPIEVRTKRLREQAGPDHETAKRKLQQKYFHYQDLDPTVPVFSFVGRIVAQKGVHLICEAAEHLINKYNGKINLLVGGPASRKDSYAGPCAARMEYLARKYPNSFWASPDEFFMDGPIVNLGSDFGMMPSAFEPGGIVQHEFFVAGTPVIAFKTGGLKDTVFEFNWDNNQGNGVIFESFNCNDFIHAMERAIGTFHNAEKYKIMRENAKKSTMDGATVTRAWCQEFYRLRGKVFIDHQQEEKVAAEINEDWDYVNYVDEYICRNVIGNQPNGSEVDYKLMSEVLKKSVKDKVVHATFKICLGTRKAHSTQIAGTFNNWKPTHQLNYDSYTNCWFVNIHLKKGKYL